MEDNDREYRYRLSFKHFPGDDYNSAAARFGFVYGYIAAENDYMIQWRGDNLKQVLDFVGKAPKFDEWFKSFEEYEEYVHSHGDIFKVFFRDDNHQEVYKGGWIIKAPDGTICTTNSVMVKHLPT